MAERGFVLAFDELVETMAVLSSVDDDLRITDRDERSAAVYQSWLQRMLAEAIFEPPQAN